MENSNLLDIKYTTYLRGIAILLIIIAHFAGGWTRYFTPCGGIGVAIFLFLSGYGINQSYKNNGLSYYFSKKIIRVVIPYFIIETIVFLFNEDFYLQEYVIDILGIKTRLWYIGFLYKQYIIYYILTKWFYKSRTSLFFIISFIILIYFPNIEAEQSFSFFTGFLVSQNNSFANKNINSKKIIVFAILLLLIGLTFLMIKQLPQIRIYIDSYIYNIIQCFIKLPIGLFIICFFTQLEYLRKNLIINYLGKISYEVYLIHIYLFAYINHCIYRGFIIIGLSIILAHIYYTFNKHLSYSIKSILGIK